MKKLKNSSRLLDATARTHNHCTLQASGWTRTASTKATLISTASLHCWRTRTKQRS